MNRLPLFIFFLPLLVFSQANILNAKSPDEIGIANAFDEVKSYPICFVFHSVGLFLYSVTILKKRQQNTTRFFDMSRRRLKTSMSL